MNHITGKRRRSGSFERMTPDRIVRGARAVGATLVLLACAVPIANAGPKPSVAQQAAVEDLAVCYARGTDALGGAVDAVLSNPLDPEDPINIGNPRFDRGLAFYRACFSKGFAFTLEIDSAFVLTVPDPATRTPETDAALQWANFVNNAFRGPGYKSTQHHMGSISSKVRGKRARMVSYLIANHVFGPTSDGPEGSVRVVGGTYTDKVVRERGRWRIKHRTLNITSDVTTFAPAP